MAASTLGSAARLLLLVGVFALGAYLQARGVLPGILGTGPTSSISRASISSSSRSRARSRSRSACRSESSLTRGPVRPYANAVTQFVNLGTTIPTLAILALAMSVLGIGAPSAIFGLVVLTLLPIVLNTIAGLQHGSRRT